MLSIKLTIVVLVFVRRRARLLREDTEDFIDRVSALRRVHLARFFFIMFEFFFRTESFERPISDREFEWLLVVESPPACPHQSLAYDDEPVASSSVNLNAIQMLFNPHAFKVNYMYWKFHNEVCGKLG
jgi:hypothetical protein